MTGPSRLALRLFASLTLLAVWAAPAGAGTVFGPYLIWMNFAEDASADAAIHDYTHAEPDPDSCWNSQALLLYQGFAKEITPELVRRAVVLHEPAQRKRLLALLRLGGDDIKAFDGVVVIPKSGSPTVMSLSASGKIKSRSAIDKAGHAIWADAFCEVLPPISRKP
jgi:hypothetical protein